MAGPADALHGSGASTVQTLFLYQVVGQLVAVLLQPAYNEVGRAVNRATTTVPLSSAQLADMVVRNIIDPQTGTIYASESGTNGDDFQRMVASAGDAPSPQDLVQALRRQVIAEHGKGPASTSFEQGIAEGRLHDKWAAVIKALANVPIPVADAVDAVVESQITHAQGEHFAFLGGVSAEDFQILVNTRGNPPSPTELNELHKRGLIPLEGTGPDQTSVQQGIFEGATKNKWWKLLAALADYIPPPRTVTALIREGSITDDQGLAFFKAAGLSQELATAYVHSAHHQKLAAAKELAKAQVDTLYHDQLINADQADTMYAALGYTPEESAFLRAIQDTRRSVTALTQAINRVHTLYVARKIDKPRAVGALDALRVPAAQRDQLLTDWDIERDVNLKVLTAAEIASAFHWKIIDQATAMDELQAIGYDARDAWILLAVREHTPLPNPPEGVTVPAGG